MVTIPGYYTAKEAAERLGFKAAASISHYCAQGKIPGAKKLGNTWIIPEIWVVEMEKTPINPKGNRGLARESKKAQKNS